MNDEKIPENDEKAVIYVTYSLGSNLKGCYSKIEEPTIEEVWDKINKLEGKYAFTYTGKEYGFAIQRHNLREVPLQKQVMKRD